MFYIHDYIKDTWRSAETWWDLVGYFYREKSNCWWINDTSNRPFENIAHNVNDKKVSYSPDIYTTVYTKRTKIIYDEDMVIVNIADIKKALKDYKSNSERNWYDKKWRRVVNYRFEFRVDPVPHVGTGRGGGSSYRKPKRNKNYFTKLQEFAEESSRARKGIFSASLWWDDCSYRKNSSNRSWKNKKKRKQWM